MWILNLFLLSILSSDGGNRALVGALKRDSTANGAVFTSVEETVKHPNLIDGSASYDFQILKLSAWVRWSCALQFNSLISIHQKENTDTLYYISLSPLFRSKRLL